MMKTLVVYYSLEGNTKEAAKVIARELKADLEDIVPKDRIEAEKFISYYWSGDKNVPERTVAIEPLKHDIEEYDLIVIGTPVWAWAPAPPIRTFLVKSDLNDRNIAVFSTSEGDRGKTFEVMRKLLSGNRIISQVDFEVPEAVDVVKMKKRAASWAKDLMKRLEREGK